VGRTESVEGEEIGDEEKSYGEVHPVCQWTLSLVHRTSSARRGVTVWDLPVVPNQYQL